MKWTKCSDQMPPKDEKFLFSYHYGIGLGQWGLHYKIIHGDSERFPEGYVLILHPVEINGGDSPFQWDEEYMIKMKVEWMLLPDHQSILYE